MLGDSRMTKFLFCKNDRIPNDIYHIAGDSIFGCALFGHTRREVIKKMAVYFRKYLPMGDGITITDEGRHPTKGYYYIYIRRE